MWAADSVPLTFTVNLPDGYSYKRTGTIDSEMGTFENKFSKGIIKFDLGLMAGVFLTDPEDVGKSELVKIIKIKGSEYPKILQASLIKNKMKNNGHLEMVALSNQDVLDFLSIVNSIDFK